MTRGNTPKRILVIRVDFLGDMLCTTAFLHALKRRWPNAELHVVATRYNAAVLDRNPDVTAIHMYVHSRQCERNARPGRLRALVDRMRLIRRLQRLRFDLAIVPNGGMHTSSMRFAQLLGAKEYRWHDAASEFDDRKPSHAIQRPLRHEALSGFLLVPELGRTEIDGLALSVYPDRALAAVWAREFGLREKPRVGLFVSNRAVERRWSDDKWRRVARALGDHADVIAFSDPGAPHDGKAWHRVGARHVAPPSVPDLIAAASQLDLVVSADSAPVHLASALRIPVIALFEDRPEKYLRWHPLGVPYEILRAGKRVDDIEADAVERAAVRLLQTFESARVPDRQR